MASLASIEKRLKAVEDNTGTGNADSTVRAICLVGVSPAEEDGLPPVRSEILSVLWVDQELAAKYGNSSRMTRPELHAILEGD